MDGRLYQISALYTHYKIDWGKDGTSLVQIPNYLFKDDQGNEKGELEYVLSEEYFI